MSQIKPYTKLAEVYDLLMDHVDYKQWSTYILKLIHKHQPDTRSVIDLSCGTGNFLIPLVKYVKSLVGCDLAKEMIYQAAKKKELKPFCLFVNDIREMAIKDHQFDCALLLYDTLNYIVDEQLLARSISEIRRIITNYGIFIFDIVTDRHCREHYADNYESEYWSNSGYSRHSYYDANNKFQHTTFRIVIKGHTYFERHKQRIYSQKFLREVLKESGFKIIEVDKNFPKRALNDGQSERTHFVCRKL